LTAAFWISFKIIKYSQFYIERTFCANQQVRIDNRMMQIERNRKPASWLNHSKNYRANVMITLDEAFSNQQKTTSRLAEIYFDNRLKYCALQMKYF